LELLAMPLIIDRDQGNPTRWARPGTAPLGTERASRASCISVALINNMPDPAFEQTESQFFDLLAAAAGDAPVFVKLYSLPGIPRGEKARKHFQGLYSTIDELWHNRFDGAIVTGTEPHEADLRSEPYWHALTEVLDWASENTTSTILSCLAAHASVLHSDGIHRHFMRGKRVGLFEVRRVGDHALMNGVPRIVRFPHSRWNEVREGELRSSGYMVVTKSTQAGVDSFVKRNGKSLFVHFQGHPEYGADTLLKEYRRDVRRFLRREREHYPTMPCAYFNAAAAKLLTEFRDKAIRDHREDLLEVFPGALVTATLERTWDVAASGVYRNWLSYVSARRTARKRIVPVAKIGRAAACRGARQQSSPTR
jgi:homoserine O-succinyltransferase/O-acetyltransferase